MVGSNKRTRAGGARGGLLLGLALPLGACTELDDDGLVSAWSGQGAEEVLVVDLHTGHGAPGTYTLLSHVSESHPDDVWLRRVFDAERIECTSASDATTGPKHGQIASGLAALVSSAAWRTVTMELGTISDTRMIVNERAEHWVHFHGDRSNPDHARIVWDHPCGSTPDDPEWERSARAHGIEVLDPARGTLTGAAVL